MEMTTLGTGRSSPVVNVTSVRCKLTESREVIMKLYVFLVNTGTTLTFDTELTVQTVADLKHAIHSKYKIAIQHQVLVVNGGECMAADRRVCTYSAGTDTNPIFLFNKEMILSERLPAIPKTTFSTENDMEIKVEESLMMPAVFHTVASRTQLAVEMYEVAKKLCSFCEGLVHDEHLQHQGWAAIMANLEDCSNSYQKLLFKFESIYSNYLQSIEDIKLKLTHLGTAVSVMAKIPLLECLTRHSYRGCLGRLGSLPEREGSEKAEVKTSAELVLSPEMPATTNKSSSASCHKSMEHVAPDPTDAESGKEIRESCQSTVQQDETSVDAKDGDLPFFNVSLLDWINVQDRPNDVESLVRKCFDSMSRLDPRIIRPFIAECRQTIANLDNQNMKAIKGLEDRLYALDQMIASCGRLVNEQKELAQGFLANQMRAENLKDASVLPDLCLSHANQLMIMLQNHRKLLDIKQKCTTAKQELANNLHVRLKWCCFVMLHADQDGEKLQALLRLVVELVERVRTVEALSTVPQVYCLAVVEVVRRKMFIKHYRETQKPRKFDCELPDISLKDLQFLQSLCPSEVQPFLRVPLLCDFEPLHQHVLALHHLVKAAQSLDEMSQTITDLLSEQKAKELSPDSIDAHTFDFETIPHPNIEQTIHQASLDLDSLAESPESDFMSAVNEFVIEENLSSPNPISDPQSPEMMVESLYSARWGEERLRLLRAELQGLEQSRRRELEGALQLRHAQEFQKLAADHQARLEKLEKESQQRIEQMQDSHAAVIQEKEQQLQELKLKVSDLSDMRCKLEVELALKEAETDEIKILLEESRAQQKETLKSLLKQETETMRTEIQQLNQKIQDNNESYQVGLAELRTLMTSEKDECISELVSRHEEESRVLRAELSRVTSSHQQACEVEKSLKGELAELQRKLDSDLSALEKEKDEKIAQQEEKYEAIIQKLEKDREKLVMSQEQEREQLLQKLTCEKAAAVQTALEGLKLEREAVEKELIEKVKHLEGQIAKSHAIESAREDSSSLVAELQEKLQEEKAKFLEQLEEQEKRKNEEMQNVRTSLIAEQQTNFNTVLTREKLRKENIINELSDKLKSATRQQERDRDLIESLSEDRARLLEERKRLEEEGGRMRAGGRVPRVRGRSHRSCAGTARRSPRGRRSGRPRRRRTRAARTRRWRPARCRCSEENTHVLSEKQRIMLLERTLQLKEEENKRLNQRLMSQSMSSVSSRHSEKIAIRELRPKSVITSDLFKLEHMHPV
ncbi:RB1-inducible coiled-coil protein 1 [Camelus dromedarius]|uniref:RB1-inducible coiled-coil protein 1 n=1 Tax=Camelus dromedarius TaxID=9838 RepID=A0A5N4CC72_CAMDR|nr:RB1-inducible coiled-coil protein 1 [Camelus dromedarius]